MDIPQAHIKLANSLNNCLSFAINMGTAHLALSKELRGKQAATFNSKDALLFTKLDKNFGDDEWKGFCIQLQI